jgi:serine protease Do
MKAKSALLFAGFLVAIILGIQLFASVQSQPNGNGRARKNGEALPNIKFDKTPLARDVAAGNSFAPIIKKVGPSVVTVYSTKTVRVGRGGIPLDDPILRRFFGEDEDEMPSRRPRERQEEGLGSGVIVSADGYILSNNHVVEGAEEIKIRFSSGGPDYEAEVVGSDPPTDLAVLRIKTTNSLIPVTIADSANLQVGDVVLAIGNPFGVGQTVTMGIVSATGRGGFGIVDYEDFIQTDASINPGNSGGALVDAQGRLVGIPTAIVSRSGGSMGIGFAVPSAMAWMVMDKIIKEGRVVRGYLGVYVQEITPELARMFNLAEGSGALVAGVVAKSPAQQAGLREGDVIVEMNGKKVSDSRAMRLQIAQAAPNTTASLKVLRDGKTQDLRTTLGELETEQFAQSPEPTRTPTRRNEAIQGVEVTDVDSRARTQLDVPPDMRGAVVTNVERDSPAYSSGLRPGDVILEVNKQKIRSAREFSEISRKTTDKAILLRVWSRSGSRYLVLETRRGR